MFRVVIVIGVAYGKFYPIMLKGKDHYGNLYYDCIIRSKGNKRKEFKIMRSQEILRGARRYIGDSKKKWRYNRGSVMNPAMILMPGELSIWGSGKP